MTASARRQPSVNRRDLLPASFDLAEFSVPGDTPFRIELDHRDVKIPHDMAICDSGPKGPGLVSMPAPRGLAS